MKAYYNEIDPFCCAVLRSRIADGSLPPGDVDERDIRLVRPEDLRGYGQCHFFAGIGGFGLAQRLAGWPDDLELWTGGFPCQPFSVAGKQLAHADERFLWPEYFRIVCACRPAWVLAENVPGLRTLGADRVCADMEGAGYAVRALVVGAWAVGAPHRRDRVWIVAKLEAAAIATDRSQVGGDKVDGENSIGPTSRVSRSGNGGLANSIQPRAGREGGAAIGWDRAAVLRQGNGASCAGRIVAAGGDVKLDNPAGPRCAGNTGCESVEEIRYETRGREPAGSCGGDELADSRREQLSGRRKPGDLAGAPEEVERAAQERERVRYAAGNGGATVADTTGGGQRADGGAAVTESGRLVHTAEPGLEGYGADAGQSQGRESRSAGASTRWPSRPGQHQHEWEAARLAQFAVGCQPDGLPEGLVQGANRDDQLAASYANKQALKAMGNAIVPQVAAEVLKAILAFEARPHSMPLSFPTTARACECGWWTRLE